MVELSGIINNDFLSKGWGTCKILVSDNRGSLTTVCHHCAFTSQYNFHMFSFSLFVFPVFKDIDSEKPMMQVGQYVFAGEYEGETGP